VPSRSGAKCRAGTHFESVESGDWDSLRGGVSDRLCDREDASDRRESRKGAPSNDGWDPAIDPGGNTLNVGTDAGEAISAMTDSVIGGGALI
jgi:hypothetical protein